MRAVQRIPVLLLTLVLVLGSASAAISSTPLPPGNKDYKVFGYNNLGMHCYDPDFSVFSLLPPFNVLRAQVIYKGGNLPKLLTNSNVNVTYSGTSDPSDSINLTSRDKTNFWDYISALFGVSRPVDVGITGAMMPGTTNALRRFQFEQPYKPFLLSDPRWFMAAGVPITDLDDSFSSNPYPLMRIQAWDRQGKGPLSSTDIVVPVSSEMNCASCHETGMDAASTPAGSTDFHGLTDDAWSQDPNPIIRYKENILTLHDAMNGTTLMNSRPVLCASCHYSKALDLSGKGTQGAQKGKLFLSLAIHRHHGLPAGPGANTNQGVIPIPEPDSGPSVTTCYFCHPGSDTQCLRSVMAQKGLVCQSCHSGLTTIGGVDANGNEIHLANGKVRQPWTDLPKCQSCHTGDATDHMGNSLVLLQAYNDGDAAANPRIASNTRFAEQAGRLYQMSAGHGSVSCEACHGSTHAEWPGRSPSNDDITATELQGHTGPIVECATCHKKPIVPGLNGPHGMHAVNDASWNKLHGRLCGRDNATCMACHGTDLTGTVLSKTHAQRNLLAKGKIPVVIPFGTPVACSTCHPGKYSPPPIAN